MPGGTRKYYAVRIGRDGPRIYDRYGDFIRATYELSGSSGKAFDTIDEAQRWLHAAAYPVGAMHTTVVKTDVNITLNVTFPREERQPEHDPPTPHPPSSDAQRLVRRTGSVDLQLSQPEIPRDPPPSAPPQPELLLSEEQKNILSLVKQGQNIFFTGAAGTGKSVLLREIIRALKQTYGPQGVAITAPTGVAGLNIGGRTIHSWAGIGLGKEPVEKILKRLSRVAMARWRNTEALVIDEISMLDGSLFDKLEFIGRTVRDPYRRFGGLQLILSGDFFQLPPVGDQDSTSSIPPLFVFEAKCWRTCVDHAEELSKVFRQKDEQFIDMLCGMRIGKLTARHIEEFRKLSRLRYYEDGIEPTHLFPLKGEVEKHNTRKLLELSGDPQVFRAMDFYGYDIGNNPIEPRQGEQLLERLIVAKEVTLKVGAQVMLLRNQSSGNLVNGSLGKVLEFMTVRQAREHYINMAEIPVEAPVPLIPADAGYYFRKEDTFPLVQFTNGLLLLCAPTDFAVENLKGGIEARRIQVPLALSYAMSIHKAQGQTLSRVKVDLDRIFEKGQAYVALSRATGMEGLEVLNFDPARITAHPKALRWLERLQLQRQNQGTQGDDPQMDDSMDWTMVSTADSVDVEMDQDFVIESYFRDVY